MSATYDCIVIGVGGFGSGALYHLARRGVRVLGIERFGIAHDRGSSHGETRIIRRAYIEHPDYIPLVDRAFEMWEELQADYGQPLLQRAPLLLTGTPSSEAITGSRLAAEKYGVDIAEVPLADARRQFPGLRFPDGFEVVVEASAGILDVENCVRAHTERAVALGAELHTGETVQKWIAADDTLRVETDRGRYEAACVILTAGPWAREWLRAVAELEIVRKPVCWHAVTTHDYAADRDAPIVYFEVPAGIFYAFPCLDGQTLKVAQHNGGDTVADPITVDRKLRPTDVAPLAEFLSAYLPGVNPRPMRHSICMYTNTRDGHFVIDAHRQYSNLILGAGFSGHGFKFTSVLGAALADLALEGKTELPVGFLSLGRESMTK